MKNGRITAKELKILSGRLRAINALFGRVAGANMVGQVKLLEKMFHELYYVADFTQQPLVRMTRILHTNRHP